MAWLRVLPMLAVMGLIFYLSHQPGDSLHLPAIPQIDKLAHGTIYLILAVTVVFALPEAGKERWRGRIVLLTVAICLLYGLSDEYHQSFVPGRTPSGWDLAADTVGATLGALGWFQWRLSRDGASQSV